MSKLANTDKLSATRSGGNAPKTNVKDLLDAGVHFGHRTSRWNPKMAPFIFGVRDNIHIINLQQTVPLFNSALKKIYQTVRDNGKVLFVSSKVQASNLVAEYAEKCGQYYLNHRWLGGTLTNWSTISQSIKQLTSIEKKLEDEELLAKYTKKEILDLNRKKEKLLRSFAGIRKIGGVPDLIIIIDTNKEHLAVKEAQKLGVPIIAIVDTNCDPEPITHPIPGNDDAIRSIRLYCEMFAEAALAGIRDSLTDSGVDASKSEKATGGDNLDNVVKLKPSNKKNITSVQAPKQEAKPATEGPAKK